MRAWLLFLGKANEVSGNHQLVVPPDLAVGDVLPLELRHPQRWRRKDVTRVILGSEPTWADLVLVDEPLTVRREQARFYLNHTAPQQTDFRSMKDCPVAINGELRKPFEWVNIHQGDQIQLSCWRFRYEYRP